MKSIKVLKLSDIERLKLEKDYHSGATHNYRIRCKSILLKSESESASKIAETLEVTIPTVYAWIKRYEENGIKGLETHPGQGRKPIMDCSDEEAVRKPLLRKTVKVCLKHANHGKIPPANKLATLLSNVF